MYDVILLVTALIVVYLGVRLVMKFREMAGWKDEDTIVTGKLGSKLPNELRELTIEEPSGDNLKHLDTSGEEQNSGADKTNTT